MKTALLHYWLTNMRGGEKVLAALGEMLPEADLLSLGDRHLHAADGAAVVGHGGDHDVALLVKTLVHRRNLGQQLRLQRVDRVVELVEVASVASLVVFVARQHEFLKLTQGVDLALHFPSFSV